MRVFLLKATLVIGLIVLLLAASGTALATFGPLHPGSILFPFQDYAEQQAGFFYHNPEAHANYLLHLVERRINNLDFRAGTKNELISMEYLDRSIDQASLAISLVPGAQSGILGMKLATQAIRADEILFQIKHVPIEQEAAFTAFRAKLRTIQHVTEAINSPINDLALVPALETIKQKNVLISRKPGYSAGGLVPFPPGSPGAVHAFYPLEGEHAVLSCASCHNQGLYIGTPDRCIYCHILKIPIPHYIGDCQLCHTPLSWTDIHFDHAAVTTITCNECHQKDIPADHYNGTCSACHITQDWTTVFFDHSVAGATDCISCHTNAAPANHYNGQCSNCHNTNNWTSVVFDHTGFSDCGSCHANDAPGNHYGGQCSNCHNTSNWHDAQFNHSGYSDCIGCHAGNAPGNHYSGQCSNCHNTNSWRGASFNHAGYTDCISCHQKDRPAEHDAGQCSECHNTQNWDAGGDAISPAVFINGKLESINCSMCHSSRTVATVGDVNQ